MSYVQIKLKFQFETGLGAAVASAAQFQGQDMENSPGSAPHGGEDCSGPSSFDCFIVHREETGRNPYDYFEKTFSEYQVFPNSQCDIAIYRQTWSFGYPPLYIPLNTKMACNLSFMGL